MDILSKKSGSTSSQLKSNIKYSLVIKVLHVGLNLFLVRYCIGLAGAENYGFWLTFLSLFTLLSCIEAGLNNGFRKSLTEAFDTQNSNAYRNIIQDMFGQASIHYFIIFLGISILIAILPLNGLLNVNFIQPTTLKLTLILCAALYCFYYILFTINTILLCIHRAKESFIWFFLQSLFQLVFLALLDFLSIEINLIALCISLCLAPTITWLLAFGYYRTSILRKPQILALFNNWKSRILMNQATSRFFVLQIALLIIISTDNFLIMKLVSPSEVTSYQVALKYFNILVIVFNTVLIPFWSAFTKEGQSNSTDWISKKMKQLLLFWLLMVFGSIFMLFVSNFVYSFWIGKQLGISLFVSILVALYTLQTLWISMYSFYLFSMEKIGTLTNLYVLAAVLNLPLSLWLGMSYGVVGIIASSIFSSLPLSIYLPLQCKKIFAISYER